MWAVGTGSHNYTRRRHVIDCVFVALNSTLSIVAMRFFSLSQDISEFSFCLLPKLFRQPAEVWKSIASLLLVTTLLFFYCDVALARRYFAASTMIATPASCLVGLGLNSWPKDFLSL